MIKIATGSATTVPQAQGSLRARARACLSSCACAAGVPCYPAHQSQQGSAPQLLIRPLDCPSPLIRRSSAQSRAGCGTATVCASFAAERPRIYGGEARRRRGLELGRRARRIRNQSPVIPGRSRPAQPALQPMHLGARPGRGCILGDPKGRRGTGDEERCGRGCAVGAAAEARLWATGDDELARRKTYRAGLRQ